MPAATVARMAAHPKVLAQIGNFLKGDLTIPQLLKNRLGLDAAFALFQGATTPGGLDEKIISGVTDFGLSAGSGLVAGGAARHLGAGRDLEAATDMIASMAGAYAAYPAGMAINRAIDKATGGPGLTDFEKMAQKDQEKLIEDIRNQTLQSVGYLPGVNPAYTSQSDYLAQLGLA